jgi:hypothetical protein
MLIRCLILLAFLNQFGLATPASDSYRKVRSPSLPSLFLQLDTQSLSPLVSQRLSFLLQSVGAYRVLSMPCNQSALNSNAEGANFDDEKLFLYFSFPRRIAFIVSFSKASDAMLLCVLTSRRHVHLAGQLRALSRSHCAV